MKLGLLPLVVLVVVIAGCEEYYGDTPSANAWLVNTVNDTAVRNAIVRQRTLYPYHFEESADGLNDLGIHDLAVLVSYHRDFEGAWGLNVRRGRTSQQLYNARVEKVLEALAEAGIDRQCVQITDVPAPGEGMESERVLLIHREMARLGGESESGITNGE